MTLCEKGQSRAKSVEAKIHVSHTVTHTQFFNTPEAYLVHSLPPEGLWESLPREALTQPFPFFGNTYFTYYSVCIHATGSATINPITCICTYTACTYTYVIARVFLAWKGEIIIKRTGLPP